MKMERSGGQKLKAFVAGAQKKLPFKDIDVGFFAEARYTDGTPIAAIAFFNEFGTKNIPERPFFRNANEGIKKPLIALLKRQFKPEDNQLVTLKTAGLAGVLHVNTIQKSITDMRDPPNAPSTIRQKGSSNPLIDTGEMRRSVTYKVNEA